MFDLPLDDSPLDDLPLDDLSPDHGCQPTAILFENADWCVAADGLEHRETGYFIARDMVSQRRGELWEWPMHLAEKSWCTLRSFREAFLAAVSAFGVEMDSGLSQSFAIAFGVVAGAGTRRGDAGFVPLGDLVRPKPASSGVARKRTPAGEARSATRRAGSLADPRTGEAARQRVAL
ncbi:hypothetical protein [Methylobacterium sp. Leaf88]|uniref:hypothetical protein n=1 Tax=Methylobacterium sp. Leaf88 TaxID=1736244 RepID=UPI000A6CFA0E|nr:hypothetical protein [Methylobacterium sp. Leaf88]